MRNVLHYEEILLDWVGYAVEEGARLHTKANGVPVIIRPNGSTAPVVCAEIVMIPTEDGPVDGRCRAPLTHLDDDGPGWGCRHGHGRDSDWTLEADLADAYYSEQNERF